MAISRYTSENYGSLVLIEYIPVSWISSFIRSSKSTIAPAGIAVKPNRSWQMLYCTRDTMGHQQNQSSDNNGQYWQQVVVGFIPGDEDQVEAGLQELHDQRYLVRVTRPNGRTYIIGTVNEPLDIDLDSNTQTNVPGTPGTAFQFTGKTLHRALLLV